MKSFKEFIAALLAPVPPIAIDAQPTHGKHSKPQPDGIAIDAQPTHGKHSKPIEEKVGIKEIPGRYGDWEDQNENTHLGETFDDVHKKLDTPRSQYHKKIGDDASRAIKEYTSYSKDINNELLNEHFGRPSMYTPKKADGDRLASRKAIYAAKHKQQVSSIDHAIDSSKLDHDLHVYHGTSSFNPGLEASKHPERKILLPAYTSTSTNKNTLAPFAISANADAEYPNRTVGHVIHIHMKKGQKGHYVGSNSEFSEDREDEMILPRKTTLQIHPKPTVLQHSLGKIKVWHATAED